MTADALVNSIWDSLYMGSVNIIARDYQFTTLSLYTKETKKLVELH